MIRPDVVDYLRQNRSKFPAESLRRQLAEEGVSDADFADSLAEAQKPVPVPAASAGKPKPRAKAAKLLLSTGLGVLVSVAIFALSRKPAAPPAPAAAPAESSGESGYVGAHGWVVRLPKDYVGVASFKNDSKDDEVVHFCKRGTDPTSFLDEGLYGELGIVRLEVAPSNFPPNATGAANLANAVSRNISSHGEKFALKNIQVGTLPGVQANVLAPFPRVEAYLLGQSDLYVFYAGQEDEIWRDIVLSLRDAHSEN